VDKDFSRQFTKCPQCGSEERFLEQLGQELKERGLARPEWSFHMDVREGLVIDQTKEAAIPIGSEVPSYGFKTDICMDCGCMYAVDITRGDIKKPPPPTQIIAPQNRAQRRRDSREGGQPPFSLS